MMNTTTITINHTDVNDIRPSYVYANVAHNTIFHHVYSVPCNTSDLVKLIWSSNTTKAVTVNGTTYTKEWEVQQWTTTETIYGDKFTKLYNVAYFATEEQAKASCTDKESDYVINHVVA